MLPREKKAGGRMRVGDSEEFVSFLSIAEFVAERCVRCSISTTYTVGKRAK